MESYAGIDENQLQALLGDPMVEVTEIERSEVEGIRATAARIIRQGRVRVQALPAEEFRVASDLHSLDLKRRDSALIRAVRPFLTFCRRDMTPIRSKMLLMAICIMKLVITTALIRLMTRSG